MDLSTAEALGNRVRKLREAKGWTQAELGSRIGKRQSVVGKYERGEVDIPFSALREIARALNIQIRDLFGYEPHLVVSGA